MDRYCLLLDAIIQSAMDAIVTFTADTMQILTINPAAERIFGYPGEQLIGVMIVGVGLPTPSFCLRVLKAYYGARFGDGFLYAWMIPAMQKVAQAGGRVIRTERDKGLILLLDDRYYDARYARLLPEHWQLTDEHMGAAVRALYGGEDT